MASGGYTCHSHATPCPCSKVPGHQGIRKWHRLHMSSWISGFIVTWDSSMDRTPTWSPVASWATVVLRGGPVQAAKLSSSWTSIVAQSRGDPTARWQVWRLSLHLNALQAVNTITQSLLGNDSMLTSVLLPHLSPLSRHSSASLHSACITLCFCLSRLSITYFLIVVLSIHTNCGAPSHMLNMPCYSYSYSWLCQEERLGLFRLAWTYVEAGLNARIPHLHSCLNLL